MQTLTEYRKRPKHTNDKDIVISSTHGLTLRGKNQFIEIRLYPDQKSSTFTTYFNRCLTQKNSKDVQQAIAHLEEETKVGFIDVGEADMIIVDIPPASNVNPLLNKMLLIREKNDVTSIRFKMV